jgi:tripartite-type tricarboxylate transporter receptor subunit TctC
MLRRLILGLLLLLSPALAFAQEWPNRPVRIVVPYPAGGGTDTVARVLAEKLGEKFGQRFIVENKPGASGMIGTQVVAKADLAPVTLLAWTPLVLAAHPSFEASTPSELIRLVQAQQVHYATPGNGSSHHLTMEYFNKLTSGQLAPVPYRGAQPAVTDTVAGHVKLTISGMPPVVPFLQSGALKAIAVTSKQRSVIFPNIPALAETPGFEEFDFTNWFSLLARAGTPVSILDRLQQASGEALKDAHVREILTTQAAEPVGNTQAQFREFIRAEVAKYAKSVDLAGVKLR